MFYILHCKCSNVRRNLAVLTYTLVPEHKLSKHFMRD